MASVQKRNDGPVGFRSLDHHDDVMLYPREWFVMAKLRAAMRYCTTGQSFLEY
jgi:hypothetical protein